jgi:hypothetical protein
MQVLKDVLLTWRTLNKQKKYEYLPLWHQLLEMGVLFLFRRIGPGYYLTARWWRSEVPFGDKWLHVNKYEYNAFIDRWNAQPYQKTSQHKVVEKAVLQLQCIPTPDFIGFLHSNCGIGTDGQPLKTLDDFYRLCQKLRGKKICLKPVEGFGGAGFFAFKVEQQNDQLVFLHPFNGQVTCISDWWSQALKNTDGYIIEQYLEQHQTLAQIHPHSVNTLRIWVYLVNGKPSIGGAFLRVGRKGSLVDNTSSGGIYCPVDLQTGVILYGANAKFPLDQMSIHPDTGGQISGIQIPFWQACQEIAGRALQAFPHVSVAGVDVAIAVDGPKMIELNVRPDQIGCARIDLPLKRLDLQMQQGK